MTNAPRQRFQVLRAVTGGCQRGPGGFCNAARRLGIVCACRGVQDGARGVDHDGRERLFAITLPARLDRGRSVATCARRRPE